MSPLNSMNVTATRTMVRRDIMEEDIAGSLVVEGPADGSCWFYGSQLAARIRMDALKL